MKSIIITIIAVFSTAVAAMAQHVDMLYTMHVNNKSGQTVDYKFKVEPTITFSDNQMTMETYVGSQVKYVLDDVENITFSGETNSIATAAQGGSKVAVYTVNGDIVISGMKSGSKADVYDAAGSRVATASADADGQATVRTGNLTKGVFVVNVPGNSFKFTK